MNDDVVKPSDADRAEAEKAHRRLYAVTSAGHEVLCRQPRRVEWRRFMDVSTADKGKVYSAMITLFTQCLVWPKPKSPEAGELEQVFEDEPQAETMLASNFIGELQKGFDGDAKKL